MEIINNLVEEIAQTVFDNVPVDNWNKVIVQTSILSTYVELTATYYINDVKGKSFDPNYENAPEEKTVDYLFIKLREEMYKLSPNKGAWYNVELVISEDGDFEINYDYDNKPNFEMEPDKEEYVIDNQEFPRDEASTPSWLTPLIQV
ncbi:immunity protein YezG family protein [Pedobacter jejuensis]|uniref:DUF600 family protein n=1 Tax=Pedobacter jejuensis TaxID=1268550 RepID=A0A3N0C0Q7_9SPHI|nr:immunity protein YezG family protein [Pedobacter jejuensis]RNL55850.1 DUF600 family protein [Pedobacter jejuensis]